MPADDPPWFNQGCNCCCHDRTTVGLTWVPDISEQIRLANEKLEEEISEKMKILAKEIKEAFEKLSDI